MSKEMKTLTYSGETYEIVDAKARQDISEKESELYTTIQNAKQAAIDIHTAEKTQIMDKLQVIENDYLKSSDKQELKTDIANAKQSAIETVLGETIDADFDTLQEVAEWIQADTTSSSELIARVTTIEENYLDATDIETELSEEGNGPIQNKVVAKALNTKQSVYVSTTGALLLDSACTALGVSPTNQYSLLSVDVYSGSKHITLRCIYKRDVLNKTFIVKQNGLSVTEINVMGSFTFSGGNSYNCIVKYLGACLDQDVTGLTTSVSYIEPTETDIVYTNGNVTGSVQDGTNKYYEKDGRVDIVFDFTSSQDLENVTICSVPRPDYRLNTPLVSISTGTSIPNGALFIIPSGDKQTGSMVVFGVKAGGRYIGSISYFRN